MSDSTEPSDFTLLVRAAAFEALLASGRASFTEADLDHDLSWLAEPARSETLRALFQDGWLEANPQGVHRLTESGLRSHEILRRAALLHGMIPDELNLEEIVHALLHRSLEELAAAGREALVPILSAPPLLATKRVVQAAETQVAGQPIRRRGLTGWLTE